MDRRKKVLGQRTSYRQDGQIIFCYGDSTGVRRFIYGQRGGDPRDLHDTLRCYCVDVLGWPAETAERYVSQDCPVLDGFTPDS